MFFWIVSQYNIIFSICVAYCIQRILHFVIEWMSALLTIRSFPSSFVVFINLFFCSFYPPFFPYLRVYYYDFLPSSIENQMCHIYIDVVATKFLFLTTLNHDEYSCHWYQNHYQVFVFYIICRSSLDAWSSHPIVHQWWHHGSILFYRNDSFHHR